MEISGNRKPCDQSKVNTGDVLPPALPPEGKKTTALEDVRPSRGTPWTCLWMIFGIADWPRVYSSAEALAMDSSLPVLREARQQIHRMHGGFNSLQLEVENAVSYREDHNDYTAGFASKLPPKCMNAPHDLAASKAGKHDLRRTGGFLLPCSS